LSPPVRSGVVVAAGQIGRRVGEEVEQLPECKRQHDEIGAALPDRKPAHQRGRRCANQDCRQQRDGNRQRCFGQHEARAVAAKSEKDALSERQQPGMAQQKVAA